MRKHWERNLTLKGVERQLGIYGMGQEGGELKKQKKEMNTTLLPLTSTLVIKSNLCIGES